MTPTITTEAVEVSAAAPFASPAQGFGTQHSPFVGLLENVNVELYHVEAVVEHGSVTYSTTGGIIPGRLTIAGGLLRQPLHVVVEPDEGNIVVSETRTQIYGVGVNLAEAIYDFRDALVDYRTTLQEAGPLSASLAAQLKLLNTLLIPS